jgi:hypothetical protein
MEWDIYLGASTLAQMIVRGNTSRASIMEALVASNQVEKAMLVERLVYLSNHPELTDEQIYNELKGA